MPRRRTVFFRSLRWRLLGWYALTLAATVAAMGATLYYAQRRTIFGQVDAELRERAEAIARGMQPQDPAARTFEVELGDALVADFAEPGGPWYAIWSSAGQTVDQSDPRSEVRRPPAPGVHVEGSRRQVAVPGPAGSLVVVGRDVSAQEADLRGLMWKVLALGGAATLVSLAGGWFLAGRALRPIRRITQAAQAISACNLSQRIDVARMEDELGALARTLNDAFDRLERAFEQQARFTADASHELRTPLSVLISQAQLALARDRDAPQYRAALETCLAAGRRMRATVEGLLKLARADAGKADIARGSVALASVVREAVALLRPAAAEHRVELSADLGAGNEDGVVIGDASLLAEMVANLVGNAVRYNRPGGRVDVRLASSA